MTKLIWTYRNILFILLIGLSCTSKKITNTGNQNDKENCCSNNLNDKLYSTKDILGSFANALNSISPDYKGVDEKGFYVNTECKLIGAFIFDLTDTLNRVTSLDDCITLKEGHVYHFAAIRNYYSFSNIAALSNGNLKIFRAINCPEKGDRAEDVIKYISDPLNQISNADEVLKRLKEYRKYGVYITQDEQSKFNCH